jgi:DNA-binding HxlR family transcriptional regulator
MVCRESAWRCDRGLASHRLYAQADQGCGHEAATNSAERLKDHLKGRYPSVVRRTALEPTCPVGTAIALLSGRWRSSVVCALLNRHPHPVRFSELRRQTSSKAGAEISAKVLIQELVALEKQRLVTRTQSGVKPPLEVRYGLTEWAARLAPVTDALGAWMTCADGCDASANVVTSAALPTAGRSEVRRPD